MRFENTEVWGFKHAIRGMRNPMNSWSKSDSVFELVDLDKTTTLSHTHDIKDSESSIIGIYDGLSCYVVRQSKEGHFLDCVIIGENDLKLAQSLIKSGSEHRKFMRQIFVSVDITAPLYWWKEFDTYKVGTVANSTSTMHKLATTPITMECFDTDDYQPDFTFEALNGFVEGLESLRQTYLETKDKKYWKELIRWLPEGWLQTRTVTLNYENLLAMCSKGQRRFHKLNEWSGIDDDNLPNFIAWARSLPYAKELIFIDDEVIS